MDLSAEGNVFGLDESVQPTPEELRDHLTEEPYHDGVRDTGGRVTLAIHALPKPVIAAINGPAVGIGATMTLGMDLRLASTKARIGFVFGRLGIVPEAASSWFLPRIVGIQQALEWVYAADILTAEQALAVAAVGARAGRPAAAAYDGGRSSSAAPPSRSAWPSSAVPQRRRRRPARGPPLRLAGDVPHLDRRRQGGGRGVPREAGAEGSPAGRPSCRGSSRLTRAGPTLVADPLRLAERALEGVRRQHLDPRGQADALPDPVGQRIGEPGVVRRVRCLDPHGELVEVPRPGQHAQVVGGQPLDGEDLLLHLEGKTFTRATIIMSSVRPVTFRIRRNAGYAVPGSRRVRSRVR